MREAKIFLIIPSKHIFACGKYLQLRGLGDIPSDISGLVISEDQTLESEDSINQTRAPRIR